MNRILIVEDDATQRLLYSRELRAAGYSVQTAANGQEALLCFATAPPDLVVLDIRMPGQDGIDVMGQILSKNRRVPIVLHSAYGCYRDNYLSWAADAYLTKSSDLAGLKNTIKALLAGQPEKFIKAGKRTVRRSKQEPPSSPKTNSSEQW